MTTFDFLLSALAVWRIAYLVAEERGPGDVFDRLRLAHRNTWLGDLLGCFYCVSLWVAVPFAVWLSSEWVRGTICWLALSGAACIARKMVDHRRELVGAAVFDDAPREEPSEALLPGDALPEGR